MNSLNYTVQDLIKSQIAFLIFPIIYVIPGYVVGWLFDLFNFRKRLFATRFVIAIVLSISLSPIVTFLTWNLISIGATYVVLALFGAFFLYILLRKKPRKLQNKAGRLQLIALLAAAGWSILSIFSLIDIQWGDRLYYTVVSYDYATRIAIINAMTRSGVPAVNPSYFPGYPILLKYLYYFWYIPCSLVDQVGGSWVDGRDAMIASISWCGLGLMAIIALYLRLRNPEKGPLAWKAGLLGSSLLLVSGLDFFPALFLMIRSRLSTGSSFLLGDIEHWNEQITAWVGALSWVPHHVAALIACLTGMLLLHSARGRNITRQLILMTIAGLAFASAVGLSVYVTFVFVIFWCIWMIILFLQKERRLCYVMAFAGLVALLAASPFLIGLLEGGASSPNQELPIAFAVRLFGPITPYLVNFPPTLKSIIYLIFLPINYLFELGFFLITGMLWIQQNVKSGWQNNPYHLAEIILIILTFLIGSFVRSTVIGSNDLGWRVWLFGQFILLIWSADVIMRIFPGLRIQNETILSFTNQKNWRLLRILLILGFITSIVDISLLRIWPILVDNGIAGFPNGFSSDTQLGRRTFAAREAYEFINNTSPVDIHIQQNPNDLINRPLGLYADRPTIISGLTAYGVSKNDFMIHFDSVKFIFGSETSWTEIDQSCIENNIDIIVVNDEDTLWKYLMVLDQTKRPLYQNPFYAVYSCGRFVKP
jgi:hypothetical protein